ncbi:MarR family transcriptional regulator [Amycolatopsis acidicola]|uniref:MarR family transcriptional regulator n=1 Tax=Amycolatopsis acidicola TaxID=2596893 RepID=A0A5N0VPW6_9PSEU|nr:MarR family transcriptional regulator [Amycolatopsis acidicola]KAA9166882.1 MarR family transcriptional regulator [Amycolatopsis acidicola]
MGDVRWLSEPEMRAWRSYIVATMGLRQRLHREMSESHDISLTDYEVLVVLDEGGRVRMSELASLLGSTKSRLSHQIGRMEDAGYVRRVADPEDKRGVAAELTDTGHAMLEKCAPTHVEGVRTHLIDLLTTEEQTLLAKAFHRVEEHLHQLDE